MGHFSKNEINKIIMNFSIKEVRNNLFDIKKASLIIIILPYIGFNFQELILSPFYSITNLFFLLVTILLIDFFYKLTFMSYSIFYKRNFV